MQHLKYQPELLQSQTCEAFFRTARSFTSTESTVINFTMMGFESKLNRIQAKTEIAHDSSNRFVFPRTQETERTITEHIFPSTENVKHLIMESKERAANTLIGFGLTREELNFDESIVLRQGSSQQSKKQAGNFEFINVDSITSEDENDYEDNLFDDDESHVIVDDEDHLIDDNEEHLSQTVAKPDEIRSDVVYDAETLFSNLSEFVNFEESRKANKNHSFKIKNLNGKIISINISTFLWICKPNIERCNTDRTKRFQEKSNKAVLPLNTTDETKSAIRRGMGSNAVLQQVCYRSRTWI